MSSSKMAHAIGVLAVLLMCTACDVSLPKLPAFDLAGDGFDMDLSLDLDTGDAEDEIDAPEDIQETPDFDSERMRRVQLDRGVLIVELEPFAWHLVPENEDGFPFRSAPSGALLVEWVEEGERRAFSDPTVPFDASAQHWSVESDLQVALDGPLQLVLVDDFSKERRAILMNITAADQGLRMTLESAQEGLEFQRVELRWSDEGGPIFGAGVHGTVNGRGETLANYWDASFGQEPNPQIAPTPFLFNPRGYGLFVETRGALAFDLEDSDIEALSLRLDAPSLELQLWLGEWRGALFGRLLREAGPVLGPPTWALYPLMASDALEGDEAVIDLMRALASWDLPLSGILWGPEWQTAHTNFEFNPALRASPEDFAASLTALGLSWVLSTTPYLNLSDDQDVGPDWGSAEALFLEADSSGYLILDEEGAAKFAWDEGRLGGMVDFTNPEASEWWRGKATMALGRGPSGVVLYRGEDLDAREGAALRLQAGRGVKGFGPFQEHFQAALWGALGVPDGLLLSTRGGLETLSSSHGVLIEGMEIDEARSAMLSLAMSGATPVLAIPAGLSPQAQREWLALALAAPTFALPKDLLLAATQDTLDAAALRTLLSLRGQLAPYFSNAALQRSAGTPWPGALAWRYPEDESLWDVETGFLVGDELLFFPAREGRAQVHLPSGSWRHWGSGALLYGGRAFQLDGELGGLVIYAREGAQIPMLPAGVSRLLDAPDASVLSLAEIDTAMVRLVGLYGGTEVLSDGSTLALTVDRQAGLATLELAKVEGTEAVYVEFLGVFPSEIRCGESPLQEEPSLAATPLANGEDAARRILSNGTLVRLVDSGTCTFDLAL